MIEHDPDSTQQLTHNLRILQAENQELSKRRDEAMLFALVAETIENLAEPVEILDAVAEHISIIMDIPYVACGSLDGNTIQSIVSYASFSDSEPLPYPITLPDRFLEQISSNETICCPSTDFVKLTREDLFDSSSITFLIPFKCKPYKHCLLILLTPEESKEEVEDRTLLFSQIIQMTARRIDHEFLSRELSSFNRRLEELVQQRSKELLQSKEKLQQMEKLEAIGTLAGGIAHDFNNLLMGIQGTADLIKEEIPPTQHHFSMLSEIEQYAEDGGALCRKLLGFARAGKYNVTVTDLKKLLPQVIELFSRTARQFVIKQDISPDLFAVEVDRSQLQQVFLNLFINAHHAMEKQGTLSISGYNQIIDSDAATLLQIEAGDYVQVEVKDTGTGIPASVLPNIFEPFFTTKKQGKGIGLGLASSYGIIRNHGGAITVESVAGSGTTFTLLLPKSEQEVTTPIKKLAHRIQQSGTVLLIDDEQFILDVGEQMLTNLGYTPLIADCGEKGCELLKEHKPDLVILDMVLPNKSGSEIFLDLRTIQPDIKIIISSGYSLDSEMRKLIQMGRCKFMQKPFSLSTLRQEIADFLAEESSEEAEKPHSR